MDQVSAPFRFTQGESVAWTMPAPDAYRPGDGWTAKAGLYSTRGSLEVEATATAGGDYAFALTASQTAALLPGPFRFQAEATKAGQRAVVESGTILVDPDASTAQVLAMSATSPARQRHAVYMGMITDPAVVKTLLPEQITEMEQAIKRLEWDIKREDDAEKLKRQTNVSRKIYTRFR